MARRVIRVMALPVAGVLLTVLLAVVAFKWGPRLGFETPCGAVVYTTTARSMTARQDLFAVAVEIERRVGCDYIVKGSVAYIPESTRQLVGVHATSAECRVGWPFRCFTLQTDLFARTVMPRSARTLIWGGSRWWPDPPEPLRFRPVDIPQLICNSAFYAGVLFIAVFMPRWLHKKLRGWLGRCPNCGYDTQGLTTSLCPECGRAWTARE